MARTKKAGRALNVDKNNAKAQNQDYKRWLNSYPNCAAWAEQYDLPALLDANGGLVVLADFLPAFVAEGVLSDLAAIKDWNQTAANRDYAHNNIDHAFMSTRKGTALEAIIRAVSLVMPDSLHSFSAAKYTRDHHIVRHDDRAYTDVLMEDGSVVQCSRDIALIVYFTKDWRPEYGGLLIDHDAPGGGRTIVPQFNCAVAFRIPRWHTVTPMKVDRARYTLFGWFLVPGRLYDLNLVDDGGEEVEVDPLALPLVVPHAPEQLLEGEDEEQEQEEGAQGGHKHKHKKAKAR